MFIRNGLTAAALVLVTALLAAGSEAAARSVWSPPATLSGDTGQTSFSAVQTGAGQAVAAWAGSAGVFAAMAGADRRFGKPQRLTRHSIANDFASLLAMDRRGDALVMWQQQYSGNPSPGSLWVSYRRADQRFGHVRRIATNVGYGEMAIDAQGNTTIAWQQLGRGDSAQVDVVERKADGRYGAIQVIADHSLGLAGLAVNGSGQAVMLLQTNHGGLLAATRPANGRFGTPIEIVSSKLQASSPAVTIDNSGVATIAWDGPFDPGASNDLPYAHLEVTTLGARATAPAPVQIVREPGLGAINTGPILAEDPRGDAILVWQTATSDDSVKPYVVVARRVAGHQFKNARRVAISYEGGNLDAAIGPTGAAIVSWDSLTLPVSAVIAASPTQGFARASAVAPSRENSAAPSAAIGSSRQATLVWWDLSTGVLQYATTN